MRILFAAIFIVFLSAANIKHELKQTKVTISKMNEKLDFLAKKILAQERYINSLNSKEQQIQEEINLLQNALKNSNKTLSELSDLKKGLSVKKESLEDEITKFISQNYYLDTKEISSLNDLIYTQIDKEVLKQYSQKIKDVIKEYKQTSATLNDTIDKINKIKNKKRALVKKQQELKKLKQQKIAELKKLKKEKDSYKQKLISMINKQKRLQKKLEELKIVKKQKEVKVKKIGSVYIKPKIARYRGKKTIPPVRGKIVKKFGSYIDPIYKIKIYNDSITIKTKPNSLVRAIFRGRVVYVGENNGKKIIFIKHPNNMFSIYANLSKISPLIKKGSYVKKGQVIARVANRLEFEVTYKDRPINPLRVINLR